MKVLLDTHAFLWLMVDDKRLSATARKIFLDKNNEIHLSVASVWEMAIKSSLKKLTLPLPIVDYVSTRTQMHNISILNITLVNFASLESLPFHHKDPFERLIISQSMTEKMPVLTRDKDFDAYPIQRLW